MFVSVVSKWIVAGYAVLLLIGGLMGYFKAGSVPSLMSSLVACSILFYSLFTSNPLTSFITLAALTMVFLWRWWKTGKTVPSLPLLVLTISTTLVLWFVETSSND
eukprot:jgi/Galph1/3568/GphlegSOOS_G2208.1